MSRSKETPPADYEGRSAEIPDDRQTVTSSISGRGVFAAACGGGR